VSAAAPAARKSRRRGILLGVRIVAHSTGAELLVMGSEQAGAR
jgi:hypothetical protein